jgi:hypothetical protein
MWHTFTSSHTLWTTTKTWLGVARSATCFTTQERARLDAIYCGWSTALAGCVFGFSVGFMIQSADRNFLISIWTKMLTKKKYLGVT